MPQLLVPTDLMEHQLLWCRNCGGVTDHSQVMFKRYKTRRLGDVVGDSTAMMRCRCCRKAHKTVNNGGEYGLGTTDQ